MTLPRAHVRDRLINVLVVDDSAVSRMHLVHLLKADPLIRVVDAVNDGQAALDFIKKQAPDAIVMDIHMPGMDGFETTRRIMEIQPVPIIICSADTTPGGVATTFRALEAGAIACVEKPVSREHPDFESMAADLRQTVRLMSEVKVVRRWPRSRSSTTPFSSARSAEPKPPTGIRLVGIGASTGGPPVLQTILAGLPKNFPVPVLIVQHITHGFLPGLVEWLGQTTGFQVQIAAHGVTPLAGHVYLAPDGFHMGLNPSGRILLTKEQPENGLRPAVSYLFRSLADVCGPDVVGVLLTGMGKDGAVELRLMKDKGAITIAQDRESSVVHGMPGEAIALGGATHVMPADKIAGLLLTLTSHRIIKKE
ncbi:MAG: response regulator receiver (CheY-like) modulated CheB methylesterase [Verrucomicrobia bacterium]|nr:response regulator receiver (CheY-like) modulated CheB methylesterase [Verrucomicrobiota bacterium]